MSALAKIHVAKKQLGMDEDAYRDMLDRTVGQRTAKGLSEAQCGKVLEEFKRLGFQPSLKGGSKTRRKALEGRFVKKLQALWIAGWNLGIVRNRDDKALLAFVKRQAGVDSTRFLHHAEDAAKAIEALKGWLARDGGVDWNRRNLEPLFKQLNGYRIARAQFTRLAPALGAPDFYREFMGEARLISGKAPHFMATEADWQPVMNEFGRRIRAAQNS